MERKHAGLAARQTGINGESCATGEMGNERAALGGSTDSCGLENSSAEAGGESLFGKQGFSAVVERV